MLQGNPITGAQRYSPLVSFDLPGHEELRYGLAIVDAADWPLVIGEPRFAHFTFIGVPEFKRLAREISPGMRFRLFDGKWHVGSGVVDEVEDRTLDE
jgi:hypothetical protein